MVGRALCRLTAMGKINKEWHLSHKMPKNPTTEQRVEWHIQHAKHCTCREMPEALANLIAQHKKKQ